jgi:hypothetical protein
MADHVVTLTLTEDEYADLEEVALSRHEHVDSTGHDLLVDAVNAELVKESSQNRSAYQSGVACERRKAVRAENRRRFEDAFAASTATLNRPAHPRAIT